MADQNKDVLINVRLKPKTRDEFKVASELRGASMSGLIHQFIIRTIREEKERTPEAFAEVSTRTTVERAEPMVSPPRHKSRARKK